MYARLRPLFSALHHPWPPIPRAPLSRTAKTIPTAATHPTEGTEAKVESRWRRLKRERRQAPTPQNRTAYSMPTTPTSLSSALSHVRAASWAKFDETLELVFRLYIDPRLAEQNLRGTLQLPHGTGRAARVAVFADGAEAAAARAAGADLVGAEELVHAIVQDKGVSLRGFAACVAVPELVPLAAQHLGRLLGPKGLMPSAKQKTVTSDVAQAVRDIKAGRLSYRTDSAGNVHLRVGKLSFDDDKLVANVLEATRVILDVRPATVKKKYMKKAVICSAMGPSVMLDLEALIRQARELA